jgi:hypothetical protein
MAVEIFLLFASSGRTGKVVCSSHRSYANEPPIPQSLIIDNTTEAQIEQERELREKILVAGIGSLERNPRFVRHDRLVSSRVIE